MRINIAELPNYLQSISYKEHGDYFEREYGHFLSSCFPNCEQFWRIFVVPFTRRMDGYPNSVAQVLDTRIGIDPKIEDLAGTNYSMFLNLVFAHFHLENKTPSSFEDVYTHLGSVCDLAELVVEKWYFLYSSLQGKEIKVLQGLSRDEFLEKAGKLYDEKYQDWYQHYLQKGKSPPINLISRSDILREYLGKDSPSRKDYAAHSQAIRQMRNVIVHDMKVARVLVKDGAMLIPKPTVITQYRSWQKVADAANELDKLKRDFAEQYGQAKEDIEALEGALNKIWELLINDILSEFFSTERTSLRDMFDIEFSSASSVILDIKSDTKSAAPQFPRPSGSYTGGTAIVDSSNNDI